MTSPDDDGSTRESPGRRQEHDDVRLTAPADPWLTEAPTSALGEATTLRDFNAAPYENTGPYENAGPGGSTAPDATRPADPVPFAEGYPQPHHDRRRRRPAVAILAACALLVAVLIAVDQFGTDTGPEASKPTPSAGTTAATATATTAIARTAAAGGPAGTKATSAEPPAPEVVYEVTASGSKNTGSVTYTDRDGDIIRLNGVPLPWRTTFTVGARPKPLVLDVQRKGGGDGGPVTCTITVGGKVLASTTADGRYAAALCSGSG